MTTDFGDKIAKLSPEKLGLLRRRLASSGTRAARGAPKLAPRAAGSDSAVPLSFAQERAWFRDVLAPGDRARNITGALRLEGRLSAAALSAALDGIVRRHETLRANFTAPDGEPLQTIAPPSRLPVGFVDLSGLGPARREAEGRRLYAEETRRGFDLSRECLLRATLVRLCAEEHLLLLAMHHIASDGWSIGVLAHELSALYTAYSQAKEPDLPELPITYGDFAAWQRGRAAAGDLEAGLAYWRRRLENLPPALRLRPDRGRAGEAHTSGDDLKGASCFRRVGKELRQRLDGLSREEQATLFTTLLTSFMMLLMRSTGQQDVLVGSPVSGRTRVETERLVGLFVNTLALRATLTPGLTFREALREVRRAVLDGLAHHEVPFERVVRELDADARASARPLFEMLFNFTPSPPRTLELPGLRATYEEPPAADAEFPAQLYVTEWEGELELRMVYQRDLYSEPRISCFLEQLLAVLRQAVDDPDRRLGDFDLTTSLSRRILPDPSAPLDAPEHEAITHTIAAWARRTPRQTAVCQGDVSLTYAELLERAAAVAERLRARGLRRGDVVAVHGPRSPGVVSSMAGVLLAGGVLLTLSTDLPSQRRRVMLEEAGGRFLLRVGRGVGDVDGTHGVDGLQVIDVDACGFTEDDGGVRDGQAVADGPEGGRLPAYVFFTSGSTGKPKGVLGTHAGLAHFLDWQRKTFGVGPGDRCGQLTGLSFDVVLRDVFLPLTSGATLVLPAPDDVATGARTLRWLERERISLIHAVPSVAEMWLADVPPDLTLARLKRVFFAGEPLTSTLVGRWRGAFPRAGEIVNLYGPTETTLAKCFYRVPPDAREGVQPLGQTLPNTQALVLNAGRRPCGVGEPGEIALRTPFRTLGYINAPEEGERRFVVSPFGDDPEDLLYLTGDRGVYAADGLLEILGRLDEQVKVRGVRVEPSEVAHTLRTFPGVASCVVVAREAGAEGFALVAYVVPAKGAEAVTAERLREFLRLRLPAPMLPSAFVFLESMPLTPNQKIDRARLPPPERPRQEAGAGYLAPRDAAEHQLAQIWESLLGVSPVGIRDNFFALGGHSLMAMRMLTQAERRLGRTIPPAALFERATIEHIAAFTRRGGEEWPRVVQLWPAEHRVKLFLVHPGGGTTQNYFPLVRRLAARVPVYGIQARGLDGRDAPHEDLEQMAAEYVAEVRRLQPEGPYLLGGHSLGGVIAFEMARQLGAAGRRVALLAMFDSALPTTPRDQPPAFDVDDEDARSLADMAAAARCFLGREVGVTYEDLRGLAADEKIERLAEALGRGDAFPSGGGVEMVRNLLDVNRAHVRARRKYRPSFSTVGITLFRAEEARPGDSRAGGASDVDGGDGLGWGAVSAEPVRVVRTPGDHLTMMAEPNVESLARALRTCLDEVIETLQEEAEK